MFFFENTYQTLPGVLWCQSLPTGCDDPQLVIFNESLAKDLGLNIENLTDQHLAEYLSGAVMPDQAQPIAQAYAGHQFGHFALLGDGRAHLLGEHLVPEGHRRAGERVDIQLKGSGQTPFSRRGDGRATLTSMLREYLVSEAMNGLGIPSSRSLAVVATGEPVIRETRVAGAVLTRVSASHLRVGTFEFARWRQDPDLLSSLLDYAVQRHYPKILRQQMTSMGHKTLLFLEQVMQSQAALIAQWMGVGFIHGVMNTDNMSLSGETIDYGPCSFMDLYDPSTVKSYIDRNGRYAYDQQPVIAQWNLARLAEALLPLIDEDQDKAVKLARDKISEFPGIYQQHWLCIMRAKLGLLAPQEGDAQLIQSLLRVMHQARMDFTNTFAALRQEKNPQEHQPEFVDWYDQWQIRRASGNLDESAALMRRSNPLVIPRNHRVEQALSAASGGDFEPFFALLRVCQRPYSDQSGLGFYQMLPEPHEVVANTFCGT